MADTDAVKYIDNIPYNKHNDAIYKCKKCGELTLIVNYCNNCFLEYDTKSIGGYPPIDINEK